MTVSTLPIQTRYHSYYTEQPEKIATNLKRKALGYNILSKITMVAMVCIMAAVLAVSFGMGASIAMLPTLVFGSVILLPFLGIAQTKLHDKSLELAFDTAMSGRVAAIFKEFKDKPVSELSQKLTESGITLEQLSMPILTEFNPQEPLKALLPLYAHYAAWNELREGSHRHVEANFNCQNENREFVLAARRHGWARLEREEILASMHAAIIQKAMLDPTSTATGPKDLGLTLHMKDPDQRFFDRLFDGNDTFVTFNEAERAPLTLDDLLEPNAQNPNLRNLAALQPDKMRMKLFNVEHEV